MLLPGPQQLRIETQSPVISSPMGHGGLRLQPCYLQSYGAWGTEASALLSAVLCGMGDWGFSPVICSSTNLSLHGVLKDLYGPAEFAA